MTDPPPNSKIALYPPDHDPPPRPRGVAPMSTKLKWPAEPQGRKSLVRPGVRPLIEVFAAAFPGSTRRGRFGIVRPAKTGTRGRNMPILADRMGLLGTETAFEGLARAKPLDAQGRSIINLGIGQPHFLTPPPIADAAAKALRDGHHGYTPANGILPLRQAV